MRGAAARLAFVCMFAFAMALTAMATSRAAEVEPPVTEPEKPHEQAVISADEISYDDSLNSVFATGNV